MSPEAKQELILASFGGDVSIAHLARQAQVPESTFRDWRKRFIEAGTATLQGRQATGFKGDPEKTALIHENARLKRMVRDLSVENLLLKKKAEWSIVLGHPLTHAIQRDLEAVIAASPWSAHRILAFLGVSEASYYRRKHGRVRQPAGGRHPLSSTTVRAILDTAHRHPEYGYRQVHAALQREHPDLKVAPISVYRVLNRHRLGLPP